MLCGAAAHESSPAIGLQEIYAKRAASPYAIYAMRYQFQLMAIMA
jgi:hypothetical protein